MGVFRKSEYKTARQLLDEYVAETEMFLAGQYIQHLAASGDPVPPWVLINTVAHAAPGEIEDIANQSTGWSVHHGSDAEWNSALVHIAREVIYCANAESRSLEDLQHSVLVPLELQWTERGDLEDLGPGQLLLAIQAVLERDQTDYL